MLPEDKYLGRLQEIIERDYFPELPKLKVCSFFYYQVRKLISYKKSSGYRSILLSKIWFKQHFFLGPEGVFRRSCSK